MDEQDPCFCLARQLRIAPAPGGGLYLISERGSQHAASPLVSDVLIQASKAQTAAEIVSALPEIPTAEIFYVLNQLQAQGVLERTASNCRPSQEIHTYSTTIGTLRLESDDRSALHLLESALSQAGITHELDIVHSSDYLRPLIVEREPAKRPWLPVKLVGERCYFGPILGKDQGVCIKCLRQRLLLNRPVEAFVDARSPGYFTQAPPSRPALAAMAERACIALTALLGAKQIELSHILEFDAQKGETKHSWTCECTDNRPVELKLADNTPVKRRLGGYRKFGAEETVAKLQPLVSDLSGLISSVGPLDLKTEKNSHSDGRHVWAASYPIIPNVAKPDASSFHGVALGKGLSEAQAQASVFCEAVERMSTQYQQSMRPHQASFEELGDLAIHPNAVAQFSAAQFRARDHWNTLSTDDRRHVPPVFCETDSHKWMPVWSVTERRQKWMIRDLCFSNAPEPRYGRFDPNGCAAGATHAEAAVQALLELIERDSVAIWWYNRIKRPAFEPEKVKDHRVRQLASGLNAQGWDCWLLDLTTDLGIPCLAAVARARSDGRWCIGFGCHYEQALAAERAMTELVQLFRADGRDGPPPWSEMEEEDESFLYGHGKATRQDARIDEIETMGGLIDWTVELLSDQGIETLVLNQTRKETGLCVVKVFAPGLRHFWPRFGEGRLYDVPVKKRWRHQPLKESQLNQTHLFL